MRLGGYIVAGKKNDCDLCGLLLVSVLAGKNNILFTIFCC